MAGKNGPARPDIMAETPFPVDVRRCNFYVLMETLHRRYGVANQEISLRTEPEQEIVRFSSDASIAFPGSDLSKLSRSHSGHFVLETKFLGFPAVSRRCPAIIWTGWHANPRRMKTA